MAVFLISYDLVKENSSHDYEPLWTELKRLSAVRTQLSAWYADLSNTQEQVYSHFLPYVDSNDRLSVIEVMQKPSWNNGLKGTRDFITAQFP